jgi:hypothetical protein
MPRPERPRRTGGDSTFDPVSLILAWGARSKTRRGAGILACLHGPRRPTQIDESPLWGRLAARLAACGPIVNRPSGTSVPPFIYLDSISRLSRLPRRHSCRRSECSSPIFMPMGGRNAGQGVQNRISRAAPQMLRIGFERSKPLSGPGALHLLPSAKLGSFRPSAGSFGVCKI